MTVAAHLTAAADLVRASLEEVHVALAALPTLDTSPQARDDRLWFESFDFERIHEQPRRALVAVLDDLAHAQRLLARLGDGTEGRTTEPCDHHINRPKPMAALERLEDAMVRLTLCGDREEHAVTEVATGRRWTVDEAQREAQAAEDALLRLWMGQEETT